MTRFLSPDVQDSADMAAPQSWNRYAYSLNNPLKLTDPDGRQPSEANELPAGPLDAFSRIMEHFEQVFRTNYMLSSEESKKLDRTMKMVTGAAIATGIVVSSFQDIFDASEPDDKDKPHIRRQKGSPEAARRLFNDATDPESTKERSDGVVIGRDKETGRTVIYRERSTDPTAKATIEEQRVTEDGNTRKREVRFDPDDEGGGGA
jgi:hypothetical protein